jgi:hypothetical protein
MIRTSLVAIAAIIAAADATAQTVQSTTVLYDVRSVQVVGNQAGSRVLRITPRTGSVVSISEAAAVTTAGAAASPGQVVDWVTTASAPQVVVVRDAQNRVVSAEFKEKPVQRTVVVTETVTAPVVTRTVTYALSPRQTAVVTRPRSDVWRYAPVQTWLSNAPRVVIVR